jgi:hypothetical protein
LIWLSPTAGAGDAIQAAQWLCHHLGIEPERLGWKAKVKHSNTAASQHDGAKPEAPAAQPPAQAKPSLAAGEGERIAIPYQGVMVPVARDRLQIAHMPGTVA